MKSWQGQETKFVQLKRDGHFLRVSKDDSGKVIATTKLDTDVTPVVKYRLLNVYRYVPVETVILGELWVPNERASYVKTAIKQQDKRLRFDVFAIESLPAGLSLRVIDELCSRWGLKYIKWGGFQLPPEDGILPANVEGLVYKDGNYLNELKWKPTKTIDLIIDSTTDGVGKFLGLIGSLVCKTNEGVIVANVSGMTDLERAEMTLDEENIIGRIVEVAYQYVGDKGKLRHPRFVRFRDDKNIKDCGLSQDPDLEAYYNA